MLSAIFEGLVPLIVATATAGLGWWRWNQQRRAEQVGLYVMPFLLAAEDLQSRLYNVQNRGGLGPLVRRMGAEGAALETLYLAARYFGWERVVLQSGPYAADPTVIGFVQELRKAFATDSTGLGPFCIFRTEQADLGRLVVRANAGQIGCQELPMHEFKAELERTGLRDSGTIAAACSAFGEGTLDSAARARLSAAHGALVEMLEYVESRERVRLFGEERRKRASAEGLASRADRRAA